MHNQHVIDFYNDRRMVYARILKENERNFIAHNTSWSKVHAEHRKYESLVVSEVIAQVTFK